MPQPIDSGEGLAEAASGVSLRRTAMRPALIAGIVDSSGSACSFVIIVAASSPYVTNRSTSSASRAIAKLPKGGEQILNGHAYHALGAFAVSEDQYMASMGPPLLEKNGYKILPLDVRQDAAWKDLTVRDEGSPVVLNPAHPSSLR